MKWIIRYICGSTKKLKTQMNMSRLIKLFAAAALITLAASCAPTHQIAVTAHRGYWQCADGGYARNSIASLAAAQKYGFWGSEFDVQMTKDFVLVVHHDPDIDGVRIWNNTWDTFRKCRLENGEKVPTLDEYLTQGEKSKTVLVCELKGQKDAAHEAYMVDKVVNAFKEHNLYDPKRVIFITFSIDMCKRLAALCPGFTVQYLNDDISPDELAKYGISGIDFHYNVFSKNPTWFQQARNHNMSINCWTANQEEDIQKMIDQQVDCITTDFPERTRQMIGYRANKRIEE